MGGINEGDFPYTDAGARLTSRLQHEASGLNLTVAGGQCFFPKATRLKDGTLGRCNIPPFYYIKPGLILDVVDAGHMRSMVRTAAGTFSGCCRRPAGGGSTGRIRRGPGLRARQSLPRVWKSGEHLRLRGRAANQCRRDERLSQLSGFQGGRRCRRQTRKAGRPDVPNDFITVMADGVIDF